MEKRFTFSRIFDTYLPATWSALISKQLTEFSQASSHGRGADQAA